MSLNPVKILTFWLIAFTFLTFPGCGKESLGKNCDPLRISVQIPAGEHPDLFWFGVEQKILQVKKGNDLVSHPWVSGQAVDLGLEEGDELTFLGSDREGRLLVTGEAVVGEEKLVSIQLRRVL